LARLTREYTDGGANICAEKEFDAVDNNDRQKFIVIVPLFLRVAIHSAVRVLPLYRWRSSLLPASFKRAFGRRAYTSPLRVLIHGWGGWDSHATFAAFALEFFDKPWRIKKHEEEHLNMKYTERLFRPPAEAESLIFQVALGCPHNTCTFCAMYKGVPYHIVPEKEILVTFEQAARWYPETRRIFLADGDVMIL
jgi:hypothetical protein